MTELPQHLAKGPVGREPLPRDVVEGHQRSRIASAACPVFAKTGYRGTTIDEIVRAAKVSVGSFYGLFDGKEECFLFLYGSIVEETREQLTAAVPQAASWAEAAPIVLRRLLEVVAAHPDRAQIVFVEALTAGSEAERLYAETMTELAGLLRRGRRQREARPELPAGLESAALAGAAWLLQQRLVEGQRKDIPGLLPELTELVLEPYLSSGDRVAVASAKPVD